MEQCMASCDGNLRKCKHSDFDPVSLSPYFALSLQFIKKNRKFPHLANKSFRKMFLNERIKSKLQSLFKLFVNFYSNTTMLTELYQFWHSRWKTIKSVFFPQKMHYCKFISFHKYDDRRTSFGWNFLKSTTKLDILKKFLKKITIFVEVFAVEKKLFIVSINIWRKKNMYQIYLYLYSHSHCWFR